MLDESQAISISSPAFAGIVERLNALNILWGVFAGAAARMYGSLRPLRDIDILIPSDAGGKVAPSFPEADLGYRPDGSVAELVLPGCEIIAGLNKYVSLEMDGPMIARLTSGWLLDVEVPALSLEDNLVFKAILGRGPEVGKHDWEDIIVMLARNNHIDWDYLRWRLDDCAPDKAPELFVRLRALMA